MHPNKISFETGEPRIGEKVRFKMDKVLQKTWSNRQDAISIQQSISSKPFLLDEGSCRR